MTKRLERPRGPFPSLPAGMDRVLKGYFDHYRKQGVLPPLIAKHLKGALTSIDLTLGFSDPQLGARLWGKLDDCVMLENGQHAPLDHKTRASAPDDVSYTEKYYQLQMNCYSLLLERNGYPISRTAIVIYYYPRDGALHDGVPFGVAIHEIATDPSAAYEVFRAARQLLEGPLPAPSGTCEFCRWLTACQSLS